MFELVDYKPEHAMEIVRTRTTQANLKFCDKVQPWAQSLAEFPAMTGLWEGRVVACGGIVVLYEKYRGEAWGLFVKDIGKIHIDPQIVRDLLYEWIIELQLVRIEAPIRADFLQGISYARYLGFEFEGILRKYHPDGVDAHMHVIIREDVQNAS